MSDKFSACSCLGKAAAIDSNIDSKVVSNVEASIDSNIDSKIVSNVEASIDSNITSPADNGYRKTPINTSGSAEKLAQDANKALRSASSLSSAADTPKPLNKILNGSFLSWNRKYFISISFLALLWFAVYSMLVPAAAWLSFDFFGLEPNSRFGPALEFFFYDTAKILMLLAAMIYAIGWIRVSLNVERVRTFLSGKHRTIGYFMGSGFGAITPFCSCSSIPLFLGFTTARIPIGTSMAFLITSPLINEIAVVLLWGLLGWKFTIVYIIVGMGAGIIGGFVMDSLKAERWLQPYLKEEIARIAELELSFDQVEKTKFKIRQRHEFASSETLMIFKRVWKWVIIGVGIGAALHGFVPENWFAENFSATKWWTVPAAVFVAIPLYSNVTGIIPIMESLLIKGLPLGTTMAFCMSSVVASIPEFLMLRQIMQPKLQAVFLIYLWIIFTLVGWIFNMLGPFILS